MKNLMIATALIFVFIIAYLSLIFAATDFTIYGSDSIPPGMGSAPVPETVLTNGNITKIELAPEASRIILSLVTTDKDGQLIITLPRELIDAKENDNDAQFKVLVDGQEKEFVESTSNSTSRTLIIPVPAGTEEIEIIGTQVIPEFPVFWIVLTTSVAGLIIASRFVKAKNNVRAM